MQLLSLRTAIAAALTGTIGTYTLANGSTTPAISVRKVGETLAAGTKVTGLEVIIIQEPDLRAIPDYREPNSQELWTVYLVSWATSTDLKTAGKKMIKAFPGATSETITVPKGVGPRNQLLLRIPDKQATNS